MTSPERAESRSGSRDGAKPRRAALPQLESLALHGSVLILLGLLLLFRGTDSHSQQQMMCRWLSMGLLVLCAWTCVSRFAITTAVAVLAFWMWVEIPDSPWTEWLPGHVVRFACVLGLVLWLVGLRHRLAAAQRLARVDGLTGLPNRQALEEALIAELGRARRFGRPFTVALLDCDGFKQINDERGHLTGDEVLKRVGQALRDQTRPFDCAGRWGGDEFLIVLSELDHDDAELVVERLRAAMRHGVERDHPSVRFSLGVVTIRNPDRSWQDCVAQADTAMYRAKRAGPDRTEFVVIEAAGHGAAPAAEDRPVSERSE